MKNKFTFVLILTFLLSSLTLSQNFYLGVGSPADPNGTSCASCHNSGSIATPVYNDWINTKHSIAQDSVSSPFYGYSCLKCHNTGWDLTMANYGADEYVDSTTNNGYTVTDQVNWDRVKNVGCEQCHGPLGDASRNLDNGAHFSPVNTPDYSADNCGTCHQDSHHPTFEEWGISKHAEFPSFIPNWTDRSARGECYRCHHAQDFVAYLEDPNYDPLTFVPDGDLVNVSCVACHDPHSSQNPGQLRLPVTGSQVICDVCHTVDTDEVDILTTPHHTTSEGLSGTENFGYQYPGETYTNSAHTFVATERCINCHVNNTGQGQFGSATGHTFLPRVVSCADAGCHGEGYYSNPYVDTVNVEFIFNYDNVQVVTDSLLNVLKAELQQVDSSLSHNESFGLPYNRALYNYEAVMNDGSHGVHNTNLVHKLLQDAIANFDPTFIEVVDGIPTTYSLEQNYPNPFNPATTIKFSIPEQGKVSLIIYDIIGNEITRLYDDELTAGNYEANWSASELASGIYMYRLQTDNFVATKKMILMK